MQRSSGNRSIAENLLIGRCRMDICTEIDFRKHAQASSRLPLHLEPRAHAELWPNLRWSVRWSRAPQERVQPPTKVDEHVKKLIRSWPLFVLFVLLDQAIRRAQLVVPRPLLHGVQLPDQVDKLQRRLLGCASGFGQHIGSLDKIASAMKRKKRKKGGGIELISTRRAKGKKEPGWN